MDVLTGLVLAQVRSWIAVSWIAIDTFLGSFSCIYGSFEERSQLRLGSCPHRIDYVDKDSVSPE
jgi:hypothetical protein